MNAISKTLIMAVLGVCVVNGLANASATKPLSLEINSTPSINPQPLPPRDPPPDFKKPKF